MPEIMNLNEERFALTWFHSSSVCSCGKIIHHGGKERVEEVACFSMASKKIEI